MSTSPRLREYGLGEQAVATLAGVQPSTVHKIATGARTRIHVDTQRRILAARFDLDQLPGHWQIDVKGTQRRIRALASIGWASSHLSQRLGLARNALSLHMEPGCRYVTAARARRVRDLFDELGMTPGPSQRAVGHALQAWLGAAARVG